MIQVKSINKQYHIGENVIEAVKDISMDFSKNGMYVILGKSGCGKTTLLNLLAGLDAYDSGQIYVNGTEISYYNDSALDDYHNLDMGIVFQEHNLLPALTVYDNLKIALSIQKWEGKDEQSVDERISNTLSHVGLKGYEKRRISELSGGERQRIAIARAIVKQPKVVFADEPTGNLDVNTSQTIFELFKKLSKEYIVIIVTHDRDSAFTYGDFIYEISNGSICDASVKNDKRGLLYSLVINCDGKEYRISELSYSEMCEYIGEKIYTASKKNKLEITQVSKEYRNDNRCTNNINREKNKTCKLSMKYKVQLAFMFLCKKKVTLAMTILLMTISTVLLYSAAVVTFYDDTKIIKTYLNKYEPELLPVYIETSYTDDFFEEHQKKVDKGIGYSPLTEETMKYADCIKVALDEDLGFETVSVAFVPSEIEGMVITDYVAAKNGIKLGDVVSYRETEFEVVDIQETDYVEYRLIEKLSYGYNSSHLDFYYNYKYNVVYLSQSLISTESKIQNVRLLIPHSDFTLYKRENSFIESEYYYYSDEIITETDLVCGRLPQSDNEVVVTDEFAMLRMNFCEEVFNECEYQFIDLYKNSFNDCFAGDLNLYKYFEEGIKVVVIINVENLYVDADVFIRSNKWNEICNDYYNFYFANNSYEVKNKQYNDFLNILEKNGYKIDEPAINQIYGFKEILQKIKPVMIILLLFTVILDVVLVMTFINISIRENRKNIGILRALGISIGTTGSILQMEFWLIYSFSILLSIPLITGIQMVANNEYSKILTDNPYEIIKWNYIIMIIIVIAKTIIGILAANVPIKRYGKMKIVELMK